MAIALQFDYQWSGALREVLSISNKGSSFGANIINLECIITVTNVGNPFLTQNPIYMYCIFGLVVLPLAYLLLPMLVLLPVYLCRKVSLEGRGDDFNVLERVNYLGRSTSASSPSSPSSCSFGVSPGSASFSFNTKEACTADSVPSEIEMGWGEASTGKNMDSRHLDERQDGQGQDALALAATQDEELRKVG